LSRRRSGWRRSPSSSSEPWTIAIISSGGAPPQLWKLGAPQHRRPFIKPLPHPINKRVRSCLAVAPGGRSSLDRGTLAALSSGGAQPLLWNFSVPQRLVAPVAPIFLRTPGNRGSLIGRSSTSALEGQRAPASPTLRQALVPSLPEIKRIRPYSGRGFCWHRSLPSDRRTLSTLSWGRAPPRLRKQRGSVLT
jgi:hypothetical protein